MATIRNTSKQYRREWKDLRLELRGLESRIYNRASSLCQRFPDIVIDEDYLFSDGKLLAKNFTNEPNCYDVVFCLQVIEKIETEIAKLHPHKQTEIDFK